MPQAIHFLCPVPRHAFVPLKVVRSTFGHLDVKGHIDVKVRERPCLVGSGYFWLEPRKFSAASCGHIRAYGGQISLHDALSREEKKKLDPPIVSTQSALCSNFSCYKQLFWEYLEGLGIHI